MKLFRSICFSAIFFILSHSLAQTKNRLTTCQRTFITGLNAEAVAKEKVGIEKISADLFLEIQNRVPCAFDERNISFNRAAEDLRRRRIDLYAFAFSIPEFKEFSEPLILYSAKRLLIVKKDFYNPSLSTEEYLKNLKLSFGALSGGKFFTSDDEIALLQKQGRILFDPFPDGLFKLFDQGKIQAFYISPTYYNLYSKKYSLGDKARIVVDKETLDLALFMSKSRMTDSEKFLFRSAVRTMKSDGTVRKILLKYLSASEFEKYYQIDN